jgi:hypothetical protein
MAARSRAECVGPHQASARTMSRSDRFSAASGNRRDRHHQCALPDPLIPLTPPSRWFCCGHNAPKSGSLVRVWKCLHRAAGLARNHPLFPAAVRAVHKTDERICRDSNSFIMRWIRPAKPPGSAPETHAPQILMHQNQAGRYKSLARDSLQTTARPDRSAPGI